MLSQVAQGPFPCTPRTVLPPVGTGTILRLEKSLSEHRVACVRAHSHSHRQELADLAAVLAMAVLFLHVRVQESTRREPHKTTVVLWTLQCSAVQERQ